MADPNRTQQLIDLKVQDRRPGAPLTGVRSQLVKQATVLLQPRGS